MNIPKRELTSSVDNLRDFIKIFDEASGCLQVSLAKPRTEIGSTKTKNLFAHYYKDIIENPKRQVRLSLRFKNNFLKYFPSKSLNYTVFKLYSQKLSSLATAKFDTSTGTDITLQISVKYFGANTVCSTLTPDCRYDNNIIRFIGNVHCPNRMCSGLLCLHEKTLQSLGRSDHQCLQFTSTCQVRNIPNEGHTNGFLKCGQRIGIFNEIQKSNQYLIRDDYCPDR